MASPTSVLALVLASDAVSPISACAPAPASCSESTMRDSEALAASLISFRRSASRREAGGELGGARGRRRHQRFDAALGLAGEALELLGLLRSARAIACSIASRCSPSAASKRAAFVLQPLQQSRSWRRDGARGGRARIRRAPWRHPRPLRCAWPGGRVRRRPCAGLRPRHWRRCGNWRPACRACCRPS